MNHSISKIKIYQSSDYKIFRFQEGNRPTNKKKQERIIKEIKAGNDILDESPILVFEKNGHLEIKDGQNRYLICKAMGRPVHYIVKKDNLSLYNLAKINSNVEKWKGTDYIHCYVKAGNDNYLQLQKFYEKYKIAIGTCLSMLTYGIQKHDGGLNILQEQFEQGVFVVKKYKDAVHLAEICKSFSEGFPMWNTRGFVIAISKILQAGLCDFDVLLKKYKRDPRRLQSQPNWKGYINNLQAIYNIDNSKQKPIY